MPPRQLAKNQEKRANRRQGVECPLNSYPKIRKRGENWEKEEKDQEKEGNIGESRKDHETEGKIIFKK